MPNPALAGSTALRLRPFRAVRYDPRRVGDISAMVCPPYDDIGPAQVRTLRFPAPPHHPVLHTTRLRAAAALARVCP
jgi:hypothetical protein